MLCVTSLRHHCHPHMSEQEWAFLMPLRGNEVTIGAIFLGSSPQNFIPWIVGMNGTLCTMQQI